MTRSKKTAKTAKVWFYRSGNDGLWRWRVRAANGKTVADSAEGYSELRKAIAGFSATLTAITTAKIVQE